METPDPAWLEGLESQIAEVGRPPARRTTAHWERLWREHYLPSLSALARDPVLQGTWELVLSRWAGLDEEGRTVGARGLALQCFSVAPELVDAVGAEVFLLFIEANITRLAPMFITAPALALGLIFARDWWRITLLEYFDHAPLALEVSPDNRLAEAPLPELRKRLAAEGHPPAEVDRAIERWTREYRDLDRSYRPATKRGRPAGAADAKPRSLPEARRRRYADALALGKDEWARLHEPDLAGAANDGDRYAAWLHARDLARRHGLENASEK